MEKNNYQTFLSDFFEKNYEEIRQIAIKCTRNNSYNPDDLIAECYIYFSDNHEKINNLEKTKDKWLMRYIAQWIYNNTQLFSSNPNQTNFAAIYGETKDMCIDEAFNLSTNELDTYKSNLYLNNIEKVKQAINELTSLDKSLFEELYVNKEQLSERKLAQKMRVSNYTVRKLKKNLVEKIKENI